MHDQIDFPAFETLPARLDSGILLLCDHASNRLPAHYGNLGLSAAHFQRHIAYDIGAADLTRRLAEKLNAPAVLSTFSRLLIDPNRGADDPTLIMQISDGAIIPGNYRLSAEEQTHRLKNYWQPYRAQARSVLEAMQCQGPLPALIFIHSFTPVWKGTPRPWQISLLWDSDRRLIDPMLHSLRAEGLQVGDNEPYDGALHGDMMHELATGRGLASLLIELRQDLIDTPAKAAQWADRLLPHIEGALKCPDAHKSVPLASRTR